MKTIIAGSRNARKWEVDDAMEAYKKHVTNDITEVVCGGAPGADWWGGLWARRNGIPVHDMPADWKNESSPTFNKRLGYDPAAGPRRNAKMADYAEALVAVWDGKSSGTLNMIQEAEKRGLPVFIHRFTRP